MNKREFAALNFDAFCVAAVRKLREPEQTALQRRVDAERVAGETLMLGQTAVVSYSGPDTDPRQPKPARRERLSEFFARGPFAPTPPALASSDPEEDQQDSTYPYHNEVDPYAEAKAAFYDGELQFRSVVSDEWLDWCSEEGGPCWDEWATARLRRKPKTADKPITPQKLRAAFERAGVRQHERLLSGEWKADYFLSSDCLFESQPHHEYRPAPGTPPAALAAFYGQWDFIDVIDENGVWEMATGSCPTWRGAASYRLPVRAKLVRPL